MIASRRHFFDRKEVDVGNKIDTVTARNKLKPRREPYWHKVSKGFFVGYRKMSEGSDGVWLFRQYSSDSRDPQRSLGPLTRFANHERFDQAVALARQLTAPGDELAAAGSDTVWDACIAYVEHIRENKGDKPAGDLEARYRRWVLHDPIHKLELKQLTRAHCQAYRRRLTAAPVVVNKQGGRRERSKDSVNRDMAAVRAALNRAYAEGLVKTDAAWREPLKAYKNVSKRRELYLDRDQRRRFIEAAPGDLSTFLRALSMLPLRPGALAQLTVGDFEERLQVLRIGRDKAGQDRKIKLPPSFLTLLEPRLSNSLPGAPLLPRSDGAFWNKDSWKWPLKEAAGRAELPKGTTAYTIRHSVITDLVHGGLDLLTVAQISGTSVAMIEKHYGHLRADAATAALAQLAL
jgi:site-specific recombinase XerD